MTTFLIAICVFFIQDELGTFIGFSEEGIPLFQSEKSSDELIAELDLKILLDPDSIIEISLNGEDIPREKWPEMLSERMSRKPLSERRNRNPDIAGQYTNKAAETYRRIGDYVGNNTITSLFRHHEDKILWGIKNQQLAREIFKNAASKQWALCLVADELESVNDEVFNEVKQKVDKIETEFAERIDEELSESDQMRLQMNLATFFGRVLETPLGHSYFSITPDQQKEFYQLRVEEDSLHRIPATPEKYAEFLSKPSEEKLLIYARKLAILNDDQLLLYFNIRSKEKKWASVDEIFATWPERDLARFRQFRKPK